MTRPAPPHSSDPAPAPQWHAFTSSKFLTALALLLFLASLALLLVNRRQSTLLQTVKQERDAALQQSRSPPATTRATDNPSTFFTPPNLAFARAQLALAQHRAADAFLWTSIAADAPANGWEIGVQFSRIYQAARSDWLPTRRIKLLNETPTAAAFGGNAGELLILAFSHHINVWNLAADQPPATFHISAPVDHLVGIDGARFAAASQRQLQIYDRLKGAEGEPHVFESPIIDLKCSAAPRLGILLDDGSAYIMHPAEKKLLATHYPPQPDDPPAKPRRVEFSPSGQILLRHADIPNQRIRLWDWQAEKSKTHDINSSGVILADDRVILGVLRDPAPTGPALYWHSDDLSINDRDDRSFAMNNTFAVGQFRLGLSGPSASPYVSSPDDQWIWLLADDAVEVYSRSRLKPISRIRIRSLWPHEARDFRLLAADPSTHQIAIFDPAEAIVFQATPHFGLADEYPPLNLNHSDQRQWTFAASRDGIFTAAAVPHLRELTIQSISFGSARLRQFRCAWPEPHEGARAIPWGMASSVNGKHVAVLWQEFHPAGTWDDHVYGRKAVVVYDMPSSGSPPDLLLKPRTYPLPSLTGIHAHRNDGIGLDPAGQIVRISIAGAETRLLSAIDGADIATIPTPFPNVTWTASPDGTLLAASSSEQRLPVHVFNAATGARLFITSDSGLARRLAFTHDNAQLHIGWSDNLISVHDTAKGSKLRELESPVAPLAITPDTMRYIAHLPDPSGHGPLVLASTETGQPLITLTDRAHPRAQAAFSNQRERFALMHSPTACIMLDLPSKDTVTSWLSHTHPRLPPPTPRQ